MNNIPLQVKKLEANLERLRARIPELPIAYVLLSRLMLHVGRGLASSLEHELRPFGFTEAEFRVLTTLFSQAEGSAHPSDLCAKTSQSPANMSRICDALVTRDLITRVASLADRRKMVLRITAQGEEVVKQLLPTLQRPLLEIFADLSDTQVQNLIAQLQAVGARLDQVTSHHPASRDE